MLNQRTWEGNDKEESTLPINERPLISLQNKGQEYYSNKMWEKRNILGLLVLVLVCFQ
jgi:hypothetical protein